MSVSNTCRRGLPAGHIADLPPKSGTALDAESAGNATNRRFTSYDRSATAGLDYAVNRNYDSRQGRFTQPDPLGMNAASLADPQSLNMYSYVGNDPMNRVDPDGQFWGALFQLIVGLFHNFKPNIISGSFAYHNVQPISVSFTPNFQNIGVAYGIFGLPLRIGGQWLPELLSPQDPWQRGIFANFEKCMNTYLPEDYPEGKPKPDDLNIGLAMYGALDDNNNTNNSAFILALWAKESAFELRPTGDHGPLELTSWWKDYSERNGLNLIVPGAYDPFGRPAGSANRNRTFTGTISANVMTAGNIIRYSQNNLHQSDRTIAYMYGPGSNKSAKDNVKTRNEYANHAMRLKNIYASLINCLKTGQ